MAYDTVILTREESHAILTLNRPPANAINEQLVRDLHAALSDVESDEAIRSLIITGAGDRIFCAGADLGSAFSGRICPRSCASATACFGASSGIPSR